MNYVCRHQLSIFFWQHPVLILRFSEWNFGLTADRKRTICTPMAAALPSPPCFVCHPSCSAHPRGMWSTSTELDPRHGWDWTAPASNSTNTGGQKMNSVAINSNKSRTSDNEIRRASRRAIH